MTAALDGGDITHDLACFGSAFSLDAQLLADEGQNSEQDRCSFPDLCREANGRA